MRDDCAILTGTANPALAAAIAQSFGLPITPCQVDRFPDGEVAVQLLAPVRHKTVFLIQPTSPPVNDHLIELLALADACRRAAAPHITAVIPYFGYARADKRVGRREPITARMVSDLIEAVGIDHVVTLDLHTPQMEGFFHVPVDSLTAVPTICAAIRAALPDGVAVVSPDAGRVSMATDYASRLAAPLIVLHKRRASGRETAVTHVVGDVRDHPCLIIDDMIATGGTIAESVRALRESGALPEMLVAATHGLFLEGALEKLERAGVRAVFITDTIAQPIVNPPRLQVVSVAPMIAAALKRFVADGSTDDVS
ncbi:MAG: ribose-phosphate pyrophosphokinase [Deltaproteobacteria bacterium]|nr:ribose-phosphate pyrophosphokinase [Deltaproteobacteria bacterium]